MLCRQRDDLIAPADEERIARDDECANPLLDKRLEGSVNFALRYQEAATSVIAPDGRCVANLAYGEEALLVVDLDPGAATGSYARRYAPDRYGE